MVNLKVILYTLLLAMFLLIECLSRAQDTHFIKLRFIRALEEHFVWTSFISFLRHRRVDINLLTCGKFLFLRPLRVRQCFLTITVED